MGKDERLDLDDNDPEYDADEYGGEEEEEDNELVNHEEEFEAEELESEGDDEEEEEAKLGEAGDAEEEEECNDVLQDRRKRKEFEVFVGSLDKGANEEDLRKVFGHVGEVTEVRIVKNPETNKSKGYAFLRFATVEQAKRAVKEVKSPMVIRLQL